MLCVLGALRLSKSTDMIAVSIASLCTPEGREIKAMRKAVTDFYYLGAYLSIVLRVLQRINLNESRISKNDIGMSQKLKVH